MQTITANGTTFIPGIRPGQKFSLALTGTFGDASIKAQYPIAGPTAATLAVDDDTDTPAFTLTAATPGTAAHAITFGIAAADGYRAAIGHTVVGTVYTILPATDAGTKSSLSTSLTGNNNDLTITAVEAGTAGDSITLALVNPGTNNAALGVVVTDSDIVVNLATNGSAAITSTANQVRQALIESAEARALVTVAFKSGNDGTGVVAALTETALTGGVAPAIATTSAGLVAYINANLAGAFTAALAEGAGDGLVVETAAAPLASGTDGTFAYYATGTAGTFTEAGEVELRNVGEWPGIALVTALATETTDVSVSILKIED